MKKNSLKINGVIFSYILLCAQNIFCQINYEKINHITYSIELNESPDNNQSHYNPLISDLELKMNRVTFDLNFNDSISKFLIKDNLLSKEDNDIILEIADMIGKEYYGKINSNISFARNLKFKEFKEFTAYSYISTKWSITNEKKYIGGYECLKAYATLQKDYGNGEKNNLYDLVAWFCPRIKSPFGPKNYNGLPGIILELEQNLVIFKAIDINSNSEENQIIIPSKNVIPEYKIYESIDK